jgi:Cyclic nucleotide-binding domain
MDDLGTILSVNNWPGHLSYLLIATSYWLTNMFWLRVVAVVGLSLEIAYFWLSGGDLRAGIGWDLIFICINLYQVYWLVKDRMSLRLPESDRELLRSVFKGLDDAQIARLLLAGEFRDIASGTTLAEENRPLEEIFFICSGRVRVTIADRQVAHLERGRFVGEVAFLTQRPANGDRNCRGRRAGACL